MQIEENNRMGKTRDLFKKIRDTKGTFPEIFIGRTDAEADTPILWPPDVKN